MAETPTARNNRQRKPWPVEIRLKKRAARLEIDFDDGQTFHYPAEYLRVESPSAEVQGHGAGEKVTVPGKKSVKIENLEPVGNYAVRILFDDGHSTGLYSWDYLYRLGREQARIWSDYLAALERLGFSRE